jgi:hypothetical protein
MYTIKDNIIYCLMEYFKEFNKTYFEFLEFIKKHNKTSKYSIFYQKNYMVKKTNPKLIIVLWNRRMAEPYYDRICNGDISFFMENSFSEINNKEVMGHIHYFKELYQTTSEENKMDFIRYVQKLTELCHLYHIK